ncbi:MAG TPA: type I DNA topoisomerase [Gemmatimonadaceae bacterium]|nr:type I DNA topoisomerase [Gemmatimonadaceae bacterium]
MATRKKQARRTTKRASTVARPAAKGKRGAGAAARGAAREKDETFSAPAGGALVVVESPAKARTIGKYLGRGFTVLPTVGHVLDLPEKKLGIDVENNFEPEYVAIEGKEKTLGDLRDAAKKARVIYLATDPDREGEAIAWHVEGQIKRKAGPPVKRAVFNEITKDAVRRAINNAGTIDQRKVDAQQARRVLDRLVGYKASPILWKTVKKGLSAGRVQTVALRLIVEREQAIRAFKPVEYWTIEALLEKEGQQFAARLHQIDGKKPEIHNEKEARSIVDAVRTHTAFTLTEIKRRERRKNPQAPFTTSTLQQEAAKKLGFGSKRTMRAAQRLYEGVPLGKEGAVGLITYMRTDSSRVAESAALAARDELRRRFGDDHLAASPQLFGTPKDANAQDAHEGIRPTEPSRHPDTVAPFLKGKDADLFKLYQLIWQRFMSSQMAPAVFDTTTADFAFKAKTRDVLFRSTGSIIKFPGFLALYKEAREEGEGRALEDEQALPPLAQGESIPVRDVTPTQHFTEPPPRFSEASLVRELEKDGIGRPSTYAAIISTIVDRRYVNLEQRRFFPTELGEQVLKVMLKQFPDTFEVGFTREMEDELDKIEEGRKQWKRSIKEFYTPFATALDKVDVTGLIMAAHDMSALEKQKCPKCGGKLVPKGGFFGPFVACVNHPKTCDYTRPLAGERKPAQLTPYKCPECGAPMVIRHGRSGDFLGCSRFPKCRGTKSMPTGVKCPKDGGDIAERKSKKRGKTFYGCENYPQCDFVCWDKPVAEKCPDCGNIGAEAKSTKARGSYRRCLKCANEWDVPDQPADAEAAELAG